MHRSRMAFALGLVGPLLVLGGCSGNDPQPKIAPPESTAPTSASPTPSGVPNGSRSREFLEGFFANVGTSASTGDTSGFLGQASPKCQNCRTLAHNIESAYANGGHVEGGSWDVVKVSRAKEQSDLGVVWNVDVKTSRERWYDSSDKLVKVVRPSVQSFGVVVAGNADNREVREMRLR